MCPAHDTNSSMVHPKSDETSPFAHRLLTILTLSRLLSWQTQSKVAMLKIGEDPITKPTLLRPSSLSTECQQWKGDNPHTAQCQQSSATNSALLESMSCLFPARTPSHR